MIDALAAVVDVRLRPPRQGDGDHGHGLLLDGPGYDRWASLLSTGAALFGPALVAGRASRRRADRALDPSRHQTAPAGVRPARRPSLFPDAGMAILRDLDGRPDELWCRADHGPHGYLSIAAHAHADALAIEFRAGSTCSPTRVRTAMGRADLANLVPIDAGPQHPGGWRGRPVRGRRPSLVDPPRPGRAGAHSRTGQWPGGRMAGRSPRLPPPAPTSCPPPERSAGPSGAPTGHRGPLDTAGAHDCRLAFQLGPNIACTLEGGRAELEWRFDRGCRSAT